MLTRLINYHPLNPRLIDRMIVIKGLPHDWIFKKHGEDDELLPPWEPDADVNIPYEIRSLCEPITYVKYFQPINTEKKSYEGFWDKRTVMGLRLDYGTGPGQEMWNRIEDYIDRTLPRGEKMPVPVLCAKDQKSPFETFLPRRSATGGGTELVKMPVPVIDLNPPVMQNVPIPTVSNAVTVELKPQVESPKPPTTGDGLESQPAAPILRCDQCGYQTSDKRAIRMHSMRKHPRQKVTA